MARKALRATLHHGDVYEVKLTPIAADVPTTGEIVRALGATSYGTSLHWDDERTGIIRSELIAGHPTGHGWVHLDIVDLVAETTEHVILVAVTITATSREDAEAAVHIAIPRPGSNYPTPSGALAAIESWWVAEDDRNDRSDNDSAVFVTPGTQSAAHELLKRHGMTEAHNDPTLGDRTSLAWD